MLIVIDEDIPRSFAQCLQEVGFEVIDIRDKNLRGSTDEKIIEFAIEKNAILLTGDLGFIHPLHLRPELKGIVINRLPQNISLSARLQRLRDLLNNIPLASLVDHITILEIGHIRRRFLKTNDN